MKSISKWSVAFLSLTALVLSACGDRKSRENYFMKEVSGIWANKGESMAVDQASPNKGRLPVDAETRRVVGINESGQIDVIMVNRSGDVKMIGLTDADDVPFGQMRITGKITGSKEAIKAVQSMQADEGLDSNITSLESYIHRLGPNKKSGRDEINFSFIELGFGSADNETKLAPSAKQDSLNPYLATQHVYVRISQEELAALRAEAMRIQSQQPTDEGDDAAGSQNETVTTPVDNGLDLLDEQCPTDPIDELSYPTCEIENEVEETDPLVPPTSPVDPF